MVTLRLSRCLMCIHAVPRPVRFQQRCFSRSIPHRTDGVYTELTAMRTRTPFISALREEQERKSLESSNSQVSKITSEQHPSLAPKSMGDSHHRVLLPLAQDPWLLDSYINSSGHIRLGTLFMDLDALAGVIAYKHTGENVMTVTAAVDRITIKRPLSSICDLELSGQVTFATGRSSMEVYLQVAKAPEEGRSVEEEDVLMTCTFTMVSLDPITKKPVAIASLKAETPEERRLFEQGEANYNAKKALLKTNLRKQAPNEEESRLIHSLWLQRLESHSPKTPSLSSPTVLSMSSTQIHSVQIMQPQYRNRHNFMIFGGFLLKSTFELAFTCASAASHTRPTFIALDPSTFENPVPVGSVLYLTATVAFTDSPLLGATGATSTMASTSTTPQNESNASTCGGYESDLLRGHTAETASASRHSHNRTRIQVRVDSKIRTIEHRAEETKPTGVFNYTFEVDGDVKVVPRTYEQFMMFLDARRRAER